MALIANPNNKHIVPSPQIPLELSFNSALASLAKWYPPRSPDRDWWWQTMGSHLETMLSAAGYSITDQFEALHFFYHLVTPRLGSKPSSPRAKWKSFMTDDYTPVEYSWKWGFGNDAPEVRYSIEPIGHYAGASPDPLNQTATCDFLTQLYSSGLQGLDLEWFNHFKHALLGPGTPASKTDVVSQSTLFMAFEIANGPVGVKAYFIPVDAPGNKVSDQISRAIASAGSPDLPAINVLYSFLRNDTHGRTISPFMLGIDCISPAESRLKIYSRSRVTTFDLVRRVMSVGGQLKGLNEVEKELHQLWNLTLGLPDDYPTDKELPSNSHETAGVLFYFDVGFKATLPDVKVYIPVRHYAPTDEVAANGLAQYLESQGRGAYVQQYLEILDTIATKDGTSNSSGVQTYISCAYKKGKLVITSYLSPQCYHPSWF
ncbi:dimethylallyl tryptophan synthase [Colletotrichum truncatum]|uniref:Dimethylallyl tryptophan synthase n=1 Tax=Colletotrichum truncatum TaxID=5467 RepID=A0ACC3YYH5_COLTU|nr:dimethylallyl tryptophan synthase [Colletotrichum truncatum]KAF6782090.1 dimethylallyl tryptophan synthase [Colletotrichum truncatum]